MILNGFTDPDGWLHWCRHREDLGKIHRARPSEVFHKNHLYSTVSESGIKDPSLERILSKLEGEAVRVVQEILRPVRLGQIPQLSPEQKRVWFLFFLMQWRRTPETQKSNTSDSQAMLMIDDILNELRAAAPDRQDEIDKLSTTQAKERTIRNVRVQSLLQFSSEALSVIERRGIAILRITKPKRSFIIGSSPVVKLTEPGRTDLNDPAVEMWLPIASDVVVGVGRGDGDICLFEVEDAVPIRQLNLAIAKQSETIAAASPALVRSIASSR